MKPVYLTMEEIAVLKSLVVNAESMLGWRGKESYDLFVLRQKLYTALTESNQAALLEEMRDDGSFGTEVR